MATLKIIRRRIASFKSTQKTTRAMKFVSAAKLRRAQEALLNAGPYSTTLARIADSLLSAESPVVKPREEAPPALLLIVVTSDRGLCGGYNANLLRKAEEVSRQSRTRGIEPQIFVLGRKGADHYRRARQKLLGDRINLVPKLAQLGLAADLASLVLSKFRGGEISEAGVAYTHFRSAISQQPSYETILPISPKQSTGDGMASERQPSVDYLIEPNREELIETVLQSYVESAIFHALLESEASEQAARMTAMDSATNNAADMIDRLSLEMNRARQAAITTELMDIVGGAEALR
jgi:F-type H+-transporting ATPase subunit gamma